ncbi:DUF1697 domain-containing protein [Treponema parvum]|uniref:DUF1697 domain-containing protein n=1 Tax=Treponema parvum TaxID=138851 RepID=A0A975F1K4_9SPIR|nr:DUF1697 domain-containing protein [Treponema parvum]QTQ12668.1 DUF1697 domain-containing protein [Treponema parvum]
MNYIALLRGINVGDSVRITMKELKALFEKTGCTNVSTYINSGNVIFTSADDRLVIRKTLEKELLKTTGTDIKVLIKTKDEIDAIAAAVPSGWKNDTEQKADVAYLFDVIDDAKIIDELPIKKKFIDIRYVKGALMWNVKRADYNKSRINKIISCGLYKDMTIRNVNTARALQTCIAAGMPKA